MITRIQALDYRCLRSVDVRLGGFHVLVGKNASGKSTFLDVLAFLGRLVSDGLDAAVEERGASFHDLVWGRQGARFELAIEAGIPDSLRSTEFRHDRVRYQVAMGLDATSNRQRIETETLTLEGPDAATAGVPVADRVRDSILLEEPDTDPGTRCIVISRGSRYFTGGRLYTEPRSDGGCEPRSGTTSRPDRTFLSGVPDDSPEFPIAAWLRATLLRSHSTLAIEGRALRDPGPPGRGPALHSDGSNMPWVAEALRQSDPAAFAQWIAHVRTALPELQDIVTVDRPEDRHRYLVLKQANGVDIPSWLASDGTLRLLALTLLAYVDADDAIHLIEEPENGIHPLAIETVVQSLRSVYRGQVLVATHSPLVVGIAEPEELLCFRRDDDGSARITSGADHPELRDWRSRADRSTLFGAGVL